MDKNRMMIFRVLFCASFFILGVRLLQVQVIDGSFYSRVAERQYFGRRTEYSTRGDIFDRNGLLLAIDVPCLSLSLDMARAKLAFGNGVYGEHVSHVTSGFPVVGNNSDGDSLQIRSLADYWAGRLKISTEMLRAKFSRSKRWVLLSHSVGIVSSEERSRWFEENLSELGATIVKTHSRYYPWTDISASVVGFTGLDRKGLEGLEYWSDKALRGTDVVVRYERDGLGRARLSADYNQLKATSGRPLHTTLDILLTNRLNKLLSPLSHWGRSISSRFLFLVEIETGSVIASVSLPIADPNYQRGFQTELVANRMGRQILIPGNSLDLLLLLSLDSRNLAYVVVRNNSKNLLTIDATKSISSIRKNSRTAKPSLLLSALRSSEIGKRVNTDFLGQSSGHIDYQLVATAIRAGESLGDFVQCTPIQLASIYVRAFFSRRFEPMVLKENTIAPPIPATHALGESASYVMLLKSPTTFGSPLLKEYDVHRKDRQADLPNVQLTVGSFKAVNRNYLLVLGLEEQIDAGGLPSLAVWRSLMEASQSFLSEASAYESVSKYANDWNSRIDSALSSPLPLIHQE